MDPELFGEPIRLQMFCKPILESPVKIFTSTNRGKSLTRRVIGLELKIC